MKVVVTGAAGFLGSRVSALLASKHSPLPVTELVMVDATSPSPPTHATCTVRTLTLDLASPTAAQLLIDASCDVLFHLAAIVSVHAESDFDLGLAVNFDATRALLEAARRSAAARSRKLKFVFTSTVGVFGGELPSTIDDLTATTPQTSYGAAKAMCELLINDYSRRGFVDGVAVRLPTVSVRPGSANLAMTSFASGIIREPLDGVVAVCPVSPELRLWLTSPETVVHNIVHAATLPAGALGAWRTLNLPGFEVSVAEMVAALRTVAGDAVAGLVRFERNEHVARMIESVPTRIDNTRALGLGFVADTDFVEVVKAYIRDDLKKKI